MKFMLFGVGSFPDKDLFGCARMKQSAYKTFLVWHNSEVLRYKRDMLEYDFNAEIYAYCRSDVLLLKHGVLKFRSLMKTLTNVDPFSVATTSASACNYIFRKNFLLENTIGIIPKTGYNVNHKQSCEALCWLEFTERKRGIKMERSACFNKGEKKIGPYRVDGYFYDANTGITEVFEFFGCYFHGCQKCYSTITQNTKLNKTMGELYGETVTRAAWLTSKGYTFTCIWGCEFSKMFDRNPVLHTIKKTLKKFEPLNPRDSFFGGRTEHFRSFWLSDKGRKDGEASTTTTNTSDDRSDAAGCNDRLRYLDFTSLYPFVNATKEYPVGHPDQVITSSACESIDLDVVNHLWGLFKCLVLPPRTLLIPVLPLRVNNKLMFPLCRVCCETAQEYCLHTEEERCFWGTFCSPELLLALRYGYKVLEISEIWHWDNRSTDLFKEYIKTFLKSKTEASGWPIDCETDPLKKKEYIKRFKEREDVTLEESNIEKNEGIRFISKLLLNSFWGYLGMRDNLPKMEYVNTYQRLTELINSNVLDVEDVSLVGEDMVMVQYRDKDPFVCESSKTNVVLASFTTAHARCCLYEVKKRLQRFILTIIITIRLSFINYF